VRKQYPETMTLKDCFFMEHEFIRLGVAYLNTAYMGAFANNISTLIGATRTVDSDWLTVERETAKIFQSMLNQPASYEGIRAYIETFRTDKGLLVFEHRDDASMNDIFNILLSMIGGSELYSSDMIDKLMEMLEEMKNTGLFLFV
jgi:hypothetical protein